MSTIPTHLTERNDAATVYVIFFILPILFYFAFYGFFFRHLFDFPVFTLTFNFHRHSNYNLTAETLEKAFSQP